MFCRNCGNQIPDGAKFCTVCGAQQQANTSYDQQQTQTQTPNVPEKKKNNIWITIIILVIAGAIGSFIGKAVFAPSLDSGSDNTPVINDPVQNTVPNAEYSKIFTDAGIVHISGIFVPGTTETSFVQKIDNGAIACSDYAHKGDIVKAWIETYYKPFPEGATEADKTAFMEEAKDIFARYEALSCCTVRYTMLNSYLCIKIEFSNVDKQEAISELYTLGAITDKNTSAISMSKTSANLISQGYVKK